MKKRYSDEENNRFSIRCMLIILGFILGAWILNIAGIFIVQQNLYLYSVICSVIIVVSVVITTRIVGFEKPCTKYIILTSMVVWFNLFYIFLTYHAVLPLIFPLIFSTIYRRKKMLWYTYVCNVVAVFAATLLGYIFGLCDANVVFTTATNTATFINNIESVTIVEGTPVLQLLLFYAVPRCLIMLGMIPILKHILEVIDKRTDELTQTIERNLQLSSQQQKIQERVIMSLSALIENRDNITGEHVRNTSNYVGFIIAKLQEQGEFADILTEEYAALCVKASPLHDVGKIKIPDSILNKPGKLTPEEFEIIKMHSIFGKEIMTDIIGDDEADSSYLTMAQTMALSHHERYDGMGYPYGQKGEEIPLCGRIMAIADVLDALLSKRQYKEAFSVEKTYGIMSAESGKQFDPLCLSALIDNWSEFVNRYLKPEE